MRCCPWIDESFSQVERGNMGMNKALFQAPPPPRFGFADNPLDRLSEKREDEAFLAAARAAPEARSLVICRDMPVLKKSGASLAAMFSLKETHQLGPGRES